MKNRITLLCAALGLTMFTVSAANAGIVGGVVDAGSTMVNPFLLSGIPIMQGNAGWNMNLITNTVASGSVTAGVNYMQGLTYSMIHADFFWVKKVYFYPSFPGDLPPSTHGTFSVELRSTAEATAWGQGSATGTSTAWVVDPPILVTATGGPSVRVPATSAPRITAVTSMWVPVGDGTWVCQAGQFIPLYADASRSGAMNRASAFATVTATVLSFTP
jgi:hypothetical protein